jgi:hypothetical protein
VFLSTKISYFSDQGSSDSEFSVVPQVDEIQEPLKHLIRWIRIRNTGFPHYICKIFKGSVEDPDPPNQMFWGLPDQNLDPLVRGIDPDPDFSIMNQCFFGFFCCLKGQ